MLEFEKIGDDIVVFSNLEEIFRHRASKSNPDGVDLEEVDEHSALKFCKHKANEIPIGFHMYWIPENRKISEYHSVIDYALTKGLDERLEFSIGYKYHLPSWDKPYNYYMFVGYYAAALENYGFTVEDNVVESSDGFLTFKTTLGGQRSIQEMCDTTKEVVQAIEENVDQQLTATDLERHILKAFKFPKEYKNICSQYLIWFGEFLENFGVNALISVSHQGEETKVIISSEHTEKMFREIEVLFSQYIALPYAEFLPASSQSPTPEQQYLITQLQTQVNHFKGQLEMKSSVLQMKEVAIQSLQDQVQSLQGQIQSHQNTIDVQKNQLLLLESIQGEEEVELFGGIVRLGEIEWGPIKISPKKLLDKAKE
ncbi:hypothetical protein [Vibrio coralliilyticus]|uniref:hypothetical protein n=1 Tax=Vibrio coralliilyticus TaxID=190893 RepID=UPI00031ECCA0|nr:hypothetical protein [Vibrio coralliilyticus]